MGCPVPCNPRPRGLLELGRATTEPSRSEPTESIQASLEDTPVARLRFPWPTDPERIRKD
ncbi:MAG: hypothetical protein ACI8QS_002660 [Planctomycetota bacterium]|jgi:hypothetical protein